MSDRSACMVGMAEYQSKLARIAQLERELAEAREELESQRKSNATDLKNMRFERQRADEANALIGRIAQALLNKSDVFTYVPSTLVEEVRQMRQRAEMAETENASLRNQRGDNLCWVSELEKPEQERAKALPEAEFLESCKRYHAQVAAGLGVFTGGRTIAQLEQRVAQLEGEVEAWGDRELTAIAILKGNAATLTTNSGIGLLAHVDQARQQIAALTQERDSQKFTLWQQEETIRQERDAHAKDAEALREEVRRLKGSAGLS